MRLIHTTHRAAATAILSGGFQDGELQGLIGHLRSGVWLSDQALSELYSVFLEIEVPDEVAARYKEESDMHGYNRWLIPAAVLNRYPVRECPAQ